MRGITYFFCTTLKQHGKTLGKKDPRKDPIVLKCFACGEVKQIDKDSLTDVRCAVFFLHLMATSTLLSSCSPCLSGGGAFLESIDRMCPRECLPLVTSHPDLEDRQMTERRSSMFQFTVLVSPFAESNGSIIRTSTSQCTFSLSMLVRSFDTIFQV